RHSPRCSRAPTTRARCATGWRCRSSGGPTSASRRSSTPCSARSGRSSPTCRARRATGGARRSRARACAGRFPTRRGRGGGEVAANGAVGIARGEGALEGCKVALWVVDGAAPLAPEDRWIAEQLHAKRVLVALNKHDLPAVTRAEHVTALLDGAPADGAD